MATELTVKNNYTRIQEISEIHKKEIAKIDQYLRVIADAKSEKVEALTHEHDLWVKQRKAEIEGIRLKIDEEMESYERKRESLVASYDERTSSFELRKRAAEAYLSVAAEINKAADDTNNTEEAVLTKGTVANETQELKSVTEVLPVIDGLDDLDFEDPESETPVKIAA